MLISRVGPGQYDAEDTVAVVFTLEEGVSGVRRIAADAAREDGRSPLNEATLLALRREGLRDRGLERIRGPLNLSTNEEVGLLIEGHATPPMFMMSHDAPHTAGRIEEQGYSKAKDIYAYECSVDDDLPEDSETFIVTLSNPTGATIGDGQVNL